MKKNYRVLMEGGVTFNLFQNEQTLQEIVNAITGEKTNYVFIGENKTALNKNKIIAIVDLDAKDN